MQTTTAEKVELTNDLPIKEQEYNLEIKALKEKHAGLSLTDLADKKTYEVIKAARIEFKNMRVGVEKYCKSLRDKATQYSKALSAKEAEIVKQIEEDENRLASEEKKYTDEQERLATEKKLAEENRIRGRAKELRQCGMIQHDTEYHYDSIIVTLVDIQGYTDEQFEAVKTKITNLVTAKAELKAEEERKAKEEAAALELQRQEQARKEEEQKKRLAEIEAREREIKEREERVAREEKERELAIKREQEKKEAEERRVIAEKERAEELERARKEAAELALKEEAERVERERLMQEEAERMAAEKEAKRIARQPDKKKLQQFANQLGMYIGEHSPELKSHESKELFARGSNLLKDALAFILKESESL